MKKAGVGIDVGGTKTLILLVDEKCEVLERVKFKTAPREGQQRFTRELTDGLKQLRDLATRRKVEIKFAGIGCAGLVDSDKGKILQSPNILALENYPIGKYVKKVLGVEPILGNDVQSGIFGEGKLGAGRGCRHVLGVFFGTGVGGAALIDGEVHHGASGFGGQIGAVLAQPLGGPKAALSHGIVDRIASKTAIAGEALVMAVKEWAPYLHKKVGSDLAKVTWGVLRKAIARGDKRVEEMIRARMRVVGIALSGVVNFMNPEMVLLGGGLVDEMPDLVLEEFEAGLREYLVPEVSEALKVKHAALGGDAVALGAAYAALEDKGKKA